MKTSLRIADARVSQRFAGTRNSASFSRVQLLLGGIEQSFAHTHADLEEFPETGLELLSIDSYC